MQKKDIAKTPKHYLYFCQ